MSSPHDDALFEFAPDESPDGLVQQGADTGAVPPPIHDEIGGLVDAISAGGRPRLSSESDPFAEAADSELADVAVVQYAMQRSTSSVFDTAAFRHIAYSIAALAFGTVIEWSVLRSVDAPPSSVAMRQPPAVEPAGTPAPASITPQAPVPTSAAPTPRATSERGPTRVVAAPPVAAGEPRAAAAPIAAPKATAAAPIDAPRAAAAASRAALPIAPVAAPLPIDAAPKNGGDLTAVSSPAVPEVIAPPPAAAAPAAASAAVSAIAVEQNAVLETLREYGQAYQALDVTATAAVWPSVDRRALTRAFSTLRSQQLALDDCTVSIAGTSATTHCHGTIEYVRRIGSPTPRTGHQDLVFKMRKRGRDWFIDGVSASESVVARR